MSNLAYLPQTGFDPEQNLIDLVEYYKKYTPFNVDANEFVWEEFKWNVTGVVSDTARKANSDKCLYFNRDNGLKNKAKESEKCMLPFHSNTLTDIAKAHITASQIMKTKTKGTLSFLISCYRFLDNELHKLNSRASGLTNRIFNEALQQAILKLELSTAYRVGTKLQQISKFIDSKKLAHVRINFKSPLKRNDIQTASDTKIDTESVTTRSEKLPTKEVLFAIAELSNLGLQGKDGLYHSMTEIFFATGLRFDEVVSLSTDCLYEREIEELNALTNQLETFNVWELKYFSKKHQVTTSKVIPDSMVDILQNAVAYVIDYLQPVRQVLSSLETEGSHNFFSKLQGKCFLSSTEVQKELECSNNSNATEKIKRLNITISKDSKRKRNYFNASELQDVTSDLATASLNKVWDELKSMTTASSLSEMLFITQHQREHETKGVNPWDFRLVSHTQYSDFMQGRETTRGKVVSIFERKGLLKDVQITSHQFRHFLNTICQLHSNISEIEIARYFGRNYMGDNEAYDHTNKTKLVMDNATDILASTGITSEQAVDGIINFTLVDSDEALETIQNLTTTLVTSIGRCQHDFNDSPCGKHYACLRGCSNYKRTKGDETEIKELERIKKQQKVQIIAAKEDVEEEYWGANNWLVSHQELYEGCDRALAIESDESIPVGEKVQVFPDGKDSCQVIGNNDAEAGGVLS